MGKKEQRHVSIIGGGIVGLATALALTERGGAGAGAAADGSGAEGGGAVAASVAGATDGGSAAARTNGPLSGAQITLYEKETTLASHQTGNNSGVIHSGIYYKPGSFKAEFCHKGRLSMVEFCRKHGIETRICGKLIVAANESEVAGLERLYARGLEHGLKVERLTATQAREIEPHVACVAAVRVPETGIVNYRQVCEKMAEVLRARGVKIVLGREIRGPGDLAEVFEENVASVANHTPPNGADAESPDAFSADIYSPDSFDRLARNKRNEMLGNSGGTQAPTHTAATHLIINCAGLHSDRVARAFGAGTRSATHASALEASADRGATSPTATTTAPLAQIVPFRGEYYELTPKKRSLVNTLIYPVPNPDFPFLGVHFTKMIDGSVHAGPNAVLALKREGYSWADISPRDLLETLTFPGFWKLAARNWREGFREMHRSLSRHEFLESLRRMIPELTAQDLVPTHAGVRAQALKSDGTLVDDFLIVETADVADCAEFPGGSPSAIHVLNAPSPAATCALEIGKYIAAKVQL